MASFGRGRGYATFALSPSQLGRAPGVLPITSTPMPMPELEGLDLNDASHTSPPKPTVQPTTSHSDSGDSSLGFAAGMAHQIGLSIGEAIVSRLESRSPSANAGGLDVSNLSLLLKSDVREPVCFRGDSSDKGTVREWEEAMLVFMRKKGFSAHEQSGEVLSRLMGRAREVVKVVLRSNPTTDLSQGPDLIFDILKQHFSDDPFSSLPVADFCATVPLTNEHAFDYWLRLNRAMEVAEDCAKRLGEQVGNPSRLLTHMFIRHCPDPELSLIFKCRPLGEWTPADIQQRLDEDRREKRLPRSAKMVPLAVTSLKQELNSAVSPTMSAAAPAVQHSGLMCLPVQLPHPQEPAEKMDRVIALLERLLEQRPIESNRQSQGGNRNRIRPSGPCEVCGVTEHDTRFHCRTNRLCYLCHASGHVRTQCPKATTAVPTERVSTLPVFQPQGN